MEEWLRKLGAMARHSALLICMACGLVVLSCVIGCTGRSSTPEPTFTADPTPTRETQDDESWHKCLSEALLLWDDAEAALLQAQDRSLDDLRGEYCDAPLQIMSKYIEARQAMSACPLPSNPVMCEVDALFQEAVSEHVRASDQFVLWCLAPASEQEFQWETMMLHRCRGDSLWDEAMELYTSVIFAPTVEAGTVCLNCLRSTFISGTNDVADALDQAFDSLGSGDSDDFCDFATAAHDRATITAVALGHCPAPGDVALAGVLGSCQDALEQLSVAIDRMLAFCETGDTGDMDKALNQLGRYNMLYDECVDALQSHP